MSDASTLIVIPTYNEREVLADIVRAVREAAPSAAVLIVDDNSPDGTGSLADQIASVDSQVEVMHRSALSGRLQAGARIAARLAAHSPDGRRFLP
jgi:dolichol-phosphate mannosyltransferase